MVDWDDGNTSDWIGPYESGQKFTISHIWKYKGTFQLKVKAKDEHGEESVWSDPLSISMPKNKGEYINILFRLFDNLKINNSLLKIIIESYRFNNTIFKIFLNHINY